jgi:hypothetical protein
LAKHHNQQLADLAEGNLADLAEEKFWRIEIGRTVVGSLFGRFVLTCPIEKLVAAWGTKKLADDQGDQGPML